MADNPSLTPRQQQVLDFIHAHQLQSGVSPSLREIQADHPVIVEVAYRALPTHAGSRALDDHYIVVHGTIGNDFVYSDPMGIGDSGPLQQISETDLMAAMAGASAPQAGFAAVRPHA